MNGNLTHREWLQRAGGPSGRPPAAVPGRPLPDGEALVQTFEGTKERLAREILAASGPMRRPDRHHHWLLSLDVDVLKQRLDLLLKEATDGHR